MSSSSTTTSSVSPPARSRARGALCALPLLIVAAAPGRARLGCPGKVPGKLLMRPVLICPDDLLGHLPGGVAFPGERVLYLVERAALRDRLRKRGDRALTADLADPAFYDQALERGTGPVIIGARPARYAQVLAAVARSAPDAPVLVVRDEDRPPLPGAITVPLAAFGDRVIHPAVERAVQRGRAERFRAHFESAEHILILMQDDPDPDAIASALALKTLLGRNRTSAPICTFGSITRPENVAMCRILDIEVEEISPKALDQFHPRPLGARHTPFA